MPYKKDGTWDMRFAKPKTTPAGCLFWMFIQLPFFLFFWLPLQLMFKLLVWLTPHLASFLAKILKNFWLFLSKKIKNYSKNKK